MNNFFYSVVFFAVFFSFQVSTFSQSLTADFEYDRSTGKYCVGDTVFFTNKSSNFNASVWNFGDKYQTYFENPFHVYLESGEYEIELAVLDSIGNQEKISKKINVFGAPEYEIEPSFSDTVILYGSVLNISVTGNYEQILWSSSENTSEISITLAGVYSAVITSSESCIDSFSFVVNFRQISEPEKDNIIVSNNILTPNGDGINDFLIIDKLEDYEFPCEIKIFNELGKLIYSSPDYRNNWQAKNTSGKLFGSGTFYYIIKSKNRNGGTGFIDVISN